MTAALAHQLPTDLAAAPAPRHGGGAPRDHLADVIPLPAARRPAPSTPARLPQRVYWRRRAVLLAVLLGVALAVLGGFSGAGADLADPVAGTAILEPGDTLWDLAVANTPVGEDPRATLAAIRDLNGFASSTVPAWTVVLLPAR